MKKGVQGSAGQTGGQALLSPCAACASALTVLTTLAGGASERSVGSEAGVVVSASS